MKVWLSELTGEYISVCLSERIDESMRVCVGRCIKKCSCLGRWMNK